ncbi:MAG TPA: PHP domain-containing protein, partial [bacterium]|nr:PHP domain-containing protein [bacterium]
MIIDLQLHSTYSDGYLSPTEVANFLAHKGVKIASLTDHNTAAGYPEFYTACSTLGIKVVPGVEIYTRFNNQQINILWYNLPLDSQEFNELMENTQKHWSTRLRWHLLKLIKAKVLVAGSETVLDQFSNYVPTNSLLDAILSLPGNREIIAETLNNPFFREEEAIALLFNNKKVGKLRPSTINL